MADKRTARHYRAFLSYSHSDANDARWLHRRLEAYRLPRRLVGTIGLRGAVPARLVPIFRDREDLPAANDLSEQVRAALSASATLVVVCSPNSAASPWVGREIATFRELHPERPVLAAIVAGDPPACFPCSLTTNGSEPLAADLRRSGDGRRLGLLKLVAGVSGVDLDVLAQRDAQRRVRRVTAVTALCVLAMVVMGTMTVLALTARADAERQRAQAEGLVEFMLTDLRDRLRGVGRLDVLSTVNERALAYYGNRPHLEDLSDESLARRARVIHLLGEDNLERHDLGAALAAFTEASRITAELTSRTPDNPRRLFDHARSLNGLGRVFEVRGDWQNAELHFASFSEAADQLLTVDPKNADYLLKAANAVIELGNIQLRGTRNCVGAEKSYRKGLALLTRASALRPGDNHILLSEANAWAWLADSFYYRELWPQSLDSRLRQYSVMARLHRRNADNKEIKFRLAAADRGLAYSFLRSGALEKARQHLVSASAEIKRLVQLDPENAEWRLLAEKLREDVQSRDFVASDDMKTAAGQHTRPALSAPRCVSGRRSAHIQPPRRHS